jgi:hypothetical protein
MLEDPSFTAGVDPAWRRAMAIHRNRTRKVAERALADNYPVLRALVGEEAFAACAAAYVAAYPPREPRLCLYGDRLEAFLPGYLPFHEMPWLEGLARLERLHLEALFAPDCQPIDPLTAFGKIGADSRMTVHPAVRMVRHQAPVASIWRAHRLGAPPAAADWIEWRPETALVVRPQGHVLVTHADGGMEAFLGACLRDETVGEAAEAARQAGADPDESFAALIDLGAFTGRERLSPPSGAPGHPCGRSTRAWPNPDGCSS